MSQQHSRRRFLQQIGLAGLSLPLISANNSCNEQQSKQRSMQQNNAKKLGIALVGLGGYATGQLAPALQQTEHCYLAGIVTGTPSKAIAWKEKYNLPEKNIYNYENYDSIKDNTDIDIIYIVLPNHLHAEYTIRGAKAGKHIICEKPMAITVADCDKMIAACKEAGRQLSIGYRLHFDPYNLEMKRLGQQKVYGNIKKISSAFSFVAQKGIWRLDKKIAGGGPLMDLGIYCMQGIMYTTGMEPVAVTAQTFPISDTEKFIDIEETLAWQMEMSNGLIAECRTSYSENSNFLKAEAEKGMFELQPAFSYSGLKGNTSNGAMDFPKLSQQAKQMDAFALSIKNKQPSIVPGEMGRRDVRIIEAIYEAMKTGKRVTV
ncbi:MAG: Gfo/Idh/MocA family oxidoreductase [Chitinophagaceae bacterium]|jgi:predicted dehydrogenase|nr:Gfo/Idh/MocA family oxidoreductase [Chitinophagaceae bacterium]